VKVGLRVVAGLNLHLETSPMTATTILTFIATVVLQIAALTLLPMTKAFTKPLATLACLAALFLAMYLFARMIASGVQFAVLIPLNAAAVPMCSLILGALFMGQGASPLKFMTLVVACALVGLAGRVA
jgi:surface polysaccharide O-acyltransferase-like enzyme